MIAIKVRRLRNLFSWMRCSNKLINVVSEALLYIKNLEYSLFRILNCFWRSLIDDFWLGFRVSFRSTHELILRKLGFKLSINEAEINLHDACKKECISKRFSLPYYSSGNSPTTFTRSYSIEYLSRIIFCECGVSNMGVSNMLYPEDFAYFGQKEQLIIKMKVTQRKLTWDSTSISRGQQFLLCKHKNPAIRLFLR